MPSPFSINGDGRILDWFRRLRSLFFVGTAFAVDRLFVLGSEVDFAFEFEHKRKFGEVIPIRDPKDIDLARSTKGCEIKRKLCEKGGRYSTHSSVVNCWTRTGINFQLRSHDWHHEESDWDF